MNRWTITKDKFLTLEEVTSLYKKLEDTKDICLQRKVNCVYIRDYYIIKTLLETGLRVAELVALKLSDLRGNALIVQNGKGNKKRNILLSIPTKRLLKEFIELKATILNEPIDDSSPLFISERKSPYTTRAIRKRVKCWFDRLGFNPFLSVHSCRHTYISHLMASGKVDIATIRNNAGHSSLAVTDIYTHAVKDSLGDIDLYSSANSRKGNYYRRSGEKD